MTRGAANERKRRQRDRKRRGEFIVNLQIGWDVIEMLIDEGLLQWSESENRKCIEVAFAAWSERQAKERHA